MGDSEAHLSKLIEMSEQRRSQPSLAGVVERELVPYFADTLNYEQICPPAESQNRLRR